MTLNDQIKAAQTEFEANLLDGDSINDCGGSMLSAKEVWDFSATQITKAVTEALTFVTLEKKKYDQGRYVNGEDKWGDRYSAVDNLGCDAFNHAIDDIEQKKKEYLGV